MTINTLNVMKSDHEDNHQHHTCNDELTMLGLTG